jgi:GH24 family phage-related lysozyme (muramidase)
MGLEMWLPFYQLQPQQASLCSLGYNLGPGQILEAIGFERAI